MYPSKVHVNRKCAYRGYISSPIQHTQKTPPLSGVWDSGVVWRFNLDGDIKPRHNRRVPAPKKFRLVPSYFGPLPASALNNALDLEIDDGDVVMSVNAQKHARRKHPEDFARCFPHVAAIVSAPLYARDDFLNEGKIELVGKSPGLDDWLLVAVEITIDGDGRYNVASFYPVSQKKVDGRRATGHLRRVILI